MRCSIRFGKSRALRYAEAVAMARAFPSYRERDGLHMVDEPITWANWRLLGDLIMLIRPWAGAVVDIAVGGRSSGPRLNTLGQLHSVFRCYEERLASGDLDLHCLGQAAPGGDPQTFGCRFLTGVDLRAVSPALTPGQTPAWWEFGTLDPDGQSFDVDAGAIEARLRAMNSDRPPTVCPRYDPRRISAVVAALPAVIHVGGEWELRYSRLDPYKAIGVQPTAGMIHFDSGEEA